jgi:hypothetical protein
MPDRYGCWLLHMLTHCYHNMPSLLLLLPHYCCCCQVL